ncbi:hypothetical protein [Streptomyces sp. NPDC006739]|uniref:hypothetical protein n=1 Tax=Streptomyces sp. NPDC006739 TaxID=3364763 RepID=UPI0036875DDE
MYPVRGELVRAVAPGMRFDPGPDPHPDLHPDPVACGLMDPPREAHSVVIERVRCQGDLTGMGLIAFVSAASAEDAVAGVRKRLLDLTSAPSGPLAGWLLTHCALGLQLADRPDDVNPRGAVNQ